MHVPIALVIALELFDSVNVTCDPTAASPPVTIANDFAVHEGRTLFLKNCAHCHGSDARGNEGPDLHALKRSDDFIARRIRNGLKGDMTAFGDKFSQQEIKALTQYLRSLK